jgi:hypothetical protein
LPQAFLAAFLLYAFNRACAARDGAFVGSEPDFCAVMRVDYAVFDPAELAAVEAPNFVILDVGGCFAVPEVDGFFVCGDVSSGLAVFVVERDLHGDSSLTAEAISAGALSFFLKTTKTKHNQSTTEM